MHRLQTITIITLLCFVNLGCEKQDAQKDIDDNSELTVADIASALDMKFWNIRLPEDHGPDDIVSFAYKYPDGRVVSKGGISSSNWKGGTVLKVILWDSEDGKTLKYMISSGGGTIKETLEKTENMKGATSSFSIGKIVNPGDLLMKFTKNSSAGDEGIRPGDIGLIVHVEKRH